MGLVAQTLVHLLADHANHFLAVMQLADLHLQWPVDEQRRQTVRSRPHRGRHDANLVEHVGLSIRSSCFSLTMGQVQCLSYTKGHFASRPRQDLYLAKEPRSDVGNAK